MSGGQKFTLTFDAQLNVGQMKGALNQIQSTLNSLHLPQNLSRGLQGTIDSLSKEIQSFEVALGKDITGKADFNKLNTQAQKITDSFEKLKLQVRDITGLSGKDLEKLFPSQITQNITSATTAINQYKQGLKEAKNEVNNAESAVNKLKSQLDEVKNKKPMSDADWKQLKNDISSAEAEVTKYKESLLQAQTAAADVERRSPNNYKKSSIWRQAQQDIELYKKAVVEADAKVAHLTQIRATGITNTKQAQEIENLNNKLTQAQERFNAAQQALQQFESAGTGGGFQKLVEQIGQLTGQDMSNFSGGLKELGEVVGRYITQQMGEASTKLQQLKTSADQASPAFKNLSSGMNDSAAAIQAFDARLQDVRAFKSRIQYFFGLNNAINLFRRAIRGAFDTIKELDKAMTETAVVTNYTVKDMWDQLPEYTKRANELGVTTKDAYESATLYFQQGLNADQAAALSVETLKMARIAGLDAAEATDRMTNALRGFNMELDTASAQRVDDVYSELAANTASNVDEISTAMTKVASLAHSANMEFETTAAFLAQIIETTRESAETAGTALKTVVARFSEVKKLVDTNQLKGQDEEGQVIDVNKVGAALRTAGIDLNKYFLGEVGLDDIFMELASKWDSLTSVQQRYIATQAAGSRQQSRFIALMQDYARMQELVGKAYNAEGASAKQFEKTQDSLQSKLARLKNAWNEFLMGLANSSIVKGVVDGLTTLLNIVNKLTTGFSEGTSFILKWVAALSSYAALKSVFKTGGFLDLLLMGGLQAGGKGALANAAVRTGLLSGLVRRGGQLQPADVLSGQAAETAAGNARAVGGRQGSVFFGGLGGLGKKVWGSAQKLGAGVTGKSIMPAAWAKNLPMGAGMISETAAGLTGIATALGAVVLAVGAAFAIYKAWEKFSPEGQLKVAKKEAEKANKEAEKAQNTYKQLNSLQDTYKEKTLDVENATTTRDREQAIRARNEAITEALQTDGTLAQYVITESINDEIVLTIDEEALANAIENIGKEAKDKEIKSKFGEANVDLAQARVLERQLERQIQGWDYAQGKTTDLENLTLEEKVQAAIEYAESASQSPELIGQIYDLYDQIIATRASAQKTAEYGYGLQLQQQNVSDALTNALIPVLGESFKRTQTQLTGDELNSILKFGESSLLPVLNAFAGKLDTSSSSLVNFNIKDDDALATLLGLDGVENIEEVYSSLEKTLKLEEDQIKDTIKANAKLLKQQQEQVTQKATERMIGNGRYSIGTMARYLSLDNFDYQQQVAGLLETLENVDYGQYLVTPMIEAMEQGDWESSGFQKWVQDIDFSNPIQTFAKLKATAEDLKSPFNAISTAILQSTDGMAQFSASSQLQFLTLSQGYDSLSESLGKYLEENGHISSGNIKELAESSADLAAMLDSGTISAKGLATALEGIETGKWDILDLSDAILAAMSAMDDLDGIVEDTINDLNSFDPGYDENDITGFINKAFENATENFEKGAYGNNAMANYMRKIFGNFEWDGKGDYGNAYKQWLQSNISWLEANKENMFSAWDNFIGQSNKLILQSGEKTAEILEKNGEIIINANGMTTEELVNAMKEQGHMTETMARMMISDFKNYSADFAHEMAENDMPGAIRAWMDALPEIDGAKIYDEADLETLATLFNKSVPEIQEAISNLNKAAQEYREIKWTDDKGNRTADSIQDAWKDIGKDLSSQFNTSFGNNISVGPELFDYDKIKQAYNDLGIPQLFESDFNQVLQAGDSFWASFFGGKPQQIAIQEGQTAGQAYAEAYQQAVNDDLAGKIGEQIVQALTATNQKVNIDFLPNTEEVDNWEPEDKSANVNWDNVYPGVPDIPNLEREVHWRNTGAYSGNSDSGARGGIVQSYASGSANYKLKSGPALTGEEGPEIVWNKEKGYAYITGESHPEFQYLQPGDRVFNAQETRKILQGAAAGGTVPSFAKGYGGATKKTSSGGGGSGSGSGDNEKTPEEWKNELDWLYNLMEDIVELERDQKVLEEKYQDYLSDQTKTGKDLYNLLIKQLGNLYTQLNHQTFALEKREQEMREFMDTTNDKDQYLWYNWNDRTIEIDWDAIDRITDEEEYKHVKELIDEAEEIQDKMDDAEDAIMDINNQIQELENIWRDNFTDFEDRVYDAIVKSYQQVIDNYSELNDTLNNSNSQILDSLQKQISLQRQIRDNTKTEEEIADDEARLAYLRRDTSGGNDLAALQLERELAEQRESYEDTLVDQAINRLQEDNDAAAQQRQQQIDIMQAQLDYQSQNGEFNAAVRELLEGAISPDGQLLTGSDLVTLLKEQENWHAMSEVSQTVWEEELNGTFKQVVAFLLKENAEQNGTFYTALTSAVNSVSAAIGSYSQAMTKMGSEIASAASGGGGGGGGGSGSGGSYGGYGGSGGTTYTAGVGGKTGTSNVSQADALKQAAVAAEKAADGYGTIAEYTNKILRGSSSSSGKVNIGGKTYRYATGGLANQTGLAWLDGTPSEPEYVLNARQTDAFLKLADVLPSMMGSGAGAQTNTFGSTYITMPVTLESVSPDYDVDRMVDLLKDKLYDAGSYRNVNSLSFIR